MKKQTKVAIAVVALTAGAATVAAAMPSGPIRGEAPAYALDGVEFVRGDGRWGGHRGMRGGRRGSMMQMLREADTNNDQALSQEEIDTFIAEKVSIGDADGNGDLTLEEFEAVWLDLSRRAMVRAFQRLDEDGDAVITGAELNDRFGDIVVRMDRNDDGVLNRDDRRRGFGRDRGGRDDR